jgi:NADH dehydrogenase
VSDRPVVVVLGGTGFLGRRVVRHLQAKSFAVRVASRHRRQSEILFDCIDPLPQSIVADIRDDVSLSNAFEGAYGVVNAISLYVERGKDTFHDLHVNAARRMAKVARRAGVERLIHVSGIGADTNSASSYIRCRGEGEQVVRAAFPGAVVIRPAVMFASDDSFLNAILTQMRRVPLFPMFGQGHTLLQPVDVEDVAEAITRVMAQPQCGLATVECGGPRIYSYEALLRTIAREAGLTPILLPIPFLVWQALAWCAEYLPTPPVTRNQVQLMQIDTVASSHLPGLNDLGISAQPIETRTQAASGDFTGW